MNLSDRPGFRPELQGIRALAVVLVVVYHADSSWLTGGYVGVDIFFVLSGYLITGLLVRDLANGDRFSVSTFYARRMRRLLPAALFVVLATTAGFALVLSPVETKMLTSTSIATIVYMSNIWFAIQATDYLADGHDSNPLLHTWSLAVEEQFYVFWPFFILALWRFSRVHNRRTSLAIGIGCLSLVSLAACIFLTKTVQPWAFFLSPTRAWEFGAGALLSVSTFHHQSLSTIWAGAMRAIGLTLILLAAIGFGASASFPGYLAIVPVAGTLLVLAAPSSGTSRRGLLSSILTSRFAQRIGDASYSWYLWHWPILLLSAQIFGNSFWSAAAGVSISLLLAFATLQLIENPLRFAQIRGLASNLAIGLAAPIFVALALIAIRLEASQDAQTPQQERFFAAAKDVAEVYRDGCFSKHLDTSPNGCVYGAEEASRTIVLLGDSHAAQWFPAVLELAKRHNARLITFLKSACPPARIDVFDDDLKRRYQECSEWRDTALEEIKRLRPQLTLVSSYSGYVPQPDSTYDERDGFRETLALLTSWEGNVVVIRDTPIPGFNVPTCLSRADHKREPVESECAFTAAPTLNAKRWASDMETIADFDAVSAVDLTELICERELCPVYQDDLVKYFDSEHLTATFVQSIADRFVELVGAHIRATTDKS